MSLRYAIFDATLIGPALALEQSATVITYTGAANINRKALVTEPKDSGIWRASVFFYGDADVTNRIAVGLAHPVSSLSAYVGGDADSYGYRVSEGQMHHNGSSIDSVTAGGKGQWIDVVLNCFTETASFFLDGQPLYELALPDAGPWCMAVTVSGATGYDLRAMLNTGQRAFSWPNGDARGWYALRESGGIVRIATRPFITVGTDTPANTVFRGDVADGSRLDLQGPLSFWPMRGNSDGSSLATQSAQIQLLNAEGRYDELLARDLRDARVRLLLIPDGADWNSAVDVSTLVVDSASAPNDATLNITMGDPLAQLDAALQTRLFDPDADETTANTVYPISLGACRSVEPGLIDGASDPALYALHDGPILGLGKVRDGGYPTTPGTGPGEYTVDAEGTLQWYGAPPFYRLTCDLSSVGGGVPLPPTSLLPVSLAGWDFASDGSGTFGGLVVEVLDRYQMTSNAGGGGGQVQAALTQTSVLTPGAAHRYRIEVVNGVGHVMLGQFREVQLAMRPTGSPGYIPFTSILRIRETGVYEGTFVYNGSVAGDFQVGMIGTQAADSVQIKMDVYLVEQPAAPLDDDTLEPIKLEPLLRELIEVRAGWPASSWDASTAAAIDAATGYAGVGVHAKEPTSIRAVLQSVLDSYCACLYRDRAGVLKVARWRRPEAGEAEGHIRTAQIMGDVRITQYLAPGLTTQAKARKNWTPLVEGQVTTDTLDVSLAERTMLMADYRVNVASPGALPNSYSHARFAAAAEFLLDARVDAQAEIDYVVGTHATPMIYAEVPVRYSLDYDRNQVWLLTWAPNDLVRYGLNARPMLVLDVIEDPIAETQTLIMIG